MTQRDEARAAFQQGQRALEQGQYRPAMAAFEQAIALTDRGTPLYGEIQIWRVTLLDMMGDRQQAQELCKKMTRYPEPETRRLAKQLLVVLEAPTLRLNEDCLTKIPDLAGLPSRDGKDWSNAPPPTNTVRPSPIKTKAPAGYQIGAPTDPSQVETEDRLFVWVMLGAIGLILAGLAWFA
jgi:tetratricopeptide (TPR) repeat protein